MIVYNNGKKPEKAMDEMHRGELLYINYGLLTEEEKEEWHKCFDEAPDFVTL